MGFRRRAFAERMSVRDIRGFRLGWIDAIHIDARGGAWAAIALRGGPPRLAPLAGATTTDEGCVWLRAHARAVHVAPRAPDAVLLGGDDAADLRRHYARELHVDATSL